MIPTCGANGAIPNSLYLRAKALEIALDFYSHISMIVIGHVFFLIMSILVFICLHRMILTLLDHVPIKSKTLKWARLAHLLLPSVMSTLSGAEVGVFIAFWVKYARHNGPGYNIANGYSILNSVRVIVFFLCSLEVLVWVLFCVMPQSAPSQFNTTKVPTPFSSYLYWVKFLTRCRAKHARS